MLIQLWADIKIANEKLEHRVVDTVIREKYPRRYGEKKSLIEEVIASMECGKKTGKREMVKEIKSEKMREKIERDLRLVYASKSIVSIRLMPSWICHAQWQPHGNCNRCNRAEGSEGIKHTKCTHSSSSSNNSE